jgi:hypothetical protein
LGKVAKCSACGKSFTVGETPKINWKPVPDTSSSADVWLRFLAGVCATVVAGVIVFVVVGLSNASLYNQYDGSGAIGETANQFRLAADRLNVLLGVVTMYVTAKASRWVYRCIVGS